ncbi:sensor histidine kinase [Cognatishimia sp. MH4019]|uniref:sensor histidine kinase n=1 Tax=Cognatishimia sp. MH4019 TaxID=2854030 RepID=UPI001CD6DFB7|nr:HWE histidine kinase domain-containing protein [Cognatishimia sp. MH4019]
MSQDQDLNYGHLSPSEMEVGLQVARVGLGKVDYRADTVRLDALSADIFGFTAGEDIPRAEFHSRIHPDDWSGIAHELDDLLAPEHANVMDLTHRILRPDGALRWLNARKQVSFEGDAPVSGIFAVVDITAAKIAEQQNDVLIGELNHRTKNLIAVIAGIARQMKRHCPPEEFADKLNERLMVLARNQDAVVEGRGSVFDLAGIVREQSKPFQSVTGKRLTVSGPELELSQSAGQVFGMVLHELLTNAVKYGALSTRDGRIALEWRVADGQVDLAWQESGGPAVTPPERSGFGGEVLSSLPRMSLEAEVTMDYASDGLRYALHLPKSALG